MGEGKALHPEREYTRMLRAVGRPIVRRLAQSIASPARNFQTSQMAAVDKGSLFSSADIADAYLKYRPTYGPEVYNAIVEYCKESPSCNFQQAVDVGCGSGQSTVPLAKCFEKVIGIDTSKEQIAKAPTHIPNLDFRTGPAEDLSPIASDSTDLVTVAQAMHWMDTDKLYSEVTRILKPGGCFIVFGYGLVGLDKAEAQDTLKYVSTFSGQMLLLDLRNGMRACCSIYCVDLQNFIQWVLRVWRSWYMYPRVGTVKKTHPKLHSLRGLIQ